MTSERNADIKNYICQTFSKEDESILFAKKNSEKNGLPNIAIPENVGKLICLLAKIQRPKRILEIGTLAGYSTLWLAKRVFSNSGFVEFSGLFWPTFD